MTEMVDAFEGRERASSRKFRLIILGGVLGYLVLETLQWLTRGAGLFSFVAAVGSAHSGTAHIDVDADALMFPIFIVVGGLVVLACRWLQIEVDWATRVGSLGPIAIIVVASLILNALCDEPIIRYYMVSSGYQRCAALDHFSDSGKGAARFESFVLKPANCRRAE